MQAIWTGDIPPARHASVRGEFSVLNSWMNRSMDLQQDAKVGLAKPAGEPEAFMGSTLTEDLPIKYAAVATEVRTGHEIWLTRGRMVDAMRASYALPGIFSPVLVGDRWLVDGALVNPVPVSVARAFGAEIVIAANVSSDIFAHGTTVYAHGPSVVSPTAAAAIGPEEAPRRGLRRLFSAERAMKREFF